MDEPNVLLKISLFYVDDTTGDIVEGENTQQ